MRYFYLVRWAASTAKLRGRTTRRVPSETTWELALLDEEKGTLAWWRLSADILKEKYAFAQEVRAEEEEAKALLAELEKRPGPVELAPGHFLNRSKATRVFVRLKDKGQAEVLEDTEFLKRYRIGRRTLVLEPRPGLPGQFRASLGTKPGQPKLNFELEPDGPDTFTLRNIPIAIEGVWNGVHVTERMLERLVHTFELLKKKIWVPLKLDHKGIQESEAVFEHGPALGWLVKLRKVGKMLVGDFAKVPRAVVRLIMNGQYTAISPEITRGLEGFSEVLTGVALLGAAMPAMTSLPRLLTLYNSGQPGERLTIVIPKERFGGGEMMEERKEEKAVPVMPPELVRLCFQRAESLQNLPELVKALQDKGYPEVLALEMLEYMPDVTLEKLELIPPYTRELWEARFDVLEDRAHMPEKAEDVIKEIEQFLELHEDELTDEEKERLAQIKRIAEENKGVTELEEAIEKEEKYPAYPKGPKAEEKRPGKEELYPESAPNVEIQMQAKELERLQAELKERAQREKDLLVQAFAQKGLTKEQLQLLDNILTALDPVLTPNPDLKSLRTSIFQLVESLGVRTETFAKKLEPETSDVDFVLELVKHSRQGRLRN